VPQAVQAALLLQLVDTLSALSAAEEQQLGLASLQQLVEQGEGLLLGVRNAAASTPAVCAPICHMAAWCAVQQYACWSKRTLLAVSPSTLLMI
jgi:hypothetical protein